MSIASWSICRAERPPWAGLPPYWPKLRNPKARMAAPYQVVDSLTKRQGGGARFGRGGRRRSLDIKINLDHAGSPHEVSLTLLVTDVRVRAPRAGRRRSEEDAHEHDHRRRRRHH